MVFGHSTFVVCWFKKKKEREIENKSHLLIEQRL